LDERSFVHLIIRDVFSKMPVDKVGSPAAKEQSFPVLLDGLYISLSALLGHTTVFLIIGRLFLSFQSKLMMIVIEIGAEVLDVVLLAK
jgi:hypothetical protein